MADLELISDESLMVRLKDGDHQAFSVLVRRHTDRFFACAFRLTHNVQEAEDVVQEAFIKLWQKPDLWDHTKGAKFTTWFYRVVTNTALDALRKAKNAQGSPQALADIASEEPTAEYITQRREEQEFLNAAIEALPERQKLALNLCFYEGLSNQEAAKILGLKPKAVESLLMRAKSGIRDYLARAGVLAPQTQARRHSYG